VPNNIFKHATSKLYSINNNLVIRQKVSPEDVKKIEKLQNIRSYFYDFIELSEDKEEIRRLAKFITQIEFQLQKLWNFKPDETMHRWFDVPKCSCPRMDNVDYLGTPYKSINHKCIIHGN
jgi:hypothetical protein